jgi:hypothetical protein
MSKKSDRPTTPRHILIYDENWEFLERYFGAGAPSNRRYGVGFMCRKLIDQGVQEMRQRMAQQTRHHLEEEEEVVNG